VLNNLSIKTKLLMLSIVSLLVLTVAISISSVMEVTSKMMTNASYKLESIRESKTDQITKFFQERIGDIKVLSRSEDVKNLSHTLHLLEEELHIDPNGKAPINNPVFKKAIDKHEEFFQGYMKDYGYYDIFLIDATHGHVLYSAAKESDFGANLKTGSLKDSGLGEVFYQTLQNKRPTFVDMKPYAPSANAPAMFLGNPVYIGGKIESVLVFQISDAAINSIMQFRKGYGASQEDYLVGPDKKMRSDSFLDPKGHSLKASFANPSGGMVDTVASQNALSGKTGTDIIIDYNGNPVLSAYSTIKVGEDLTWAILSEIDEAELMQTPYSIAISIAIISIIILVIISFVTVVMINNGIVKPLKEFENGLLGFFQYLNREKSDVVDLNSSSNDEIGNMARVVNKNIAKTKHSVEEDRGVINDVVNVLAEFEQGDLCQRVKSNSSNPALQELTNLLNQMGTNMENNIDGVLDVLEQYSNYNYMNKVDTNNIKEHLLKLANGVNSLGDAITGMLVENKQNGITLQNSSDTLLENVSTLSSNSNEAAAALEETAAALEEVTSNVASTTNNVVQMAQFASQVTASASKGEDLATQTTNAMDHINSEVTAISEAISVIDQIAFQTNILSLNAAVEAATAGEAGKGFAVVAQEVRNLASRSAEAARGIKELVENATNKANDGKKIADQMIQGYNSLNENIDKTIELINDVESASKEQRAGIEQINDAINALDRQTQENANIASATKDIASRTDDIANTVVKNADEKEFRGKNDIKIEVRKSVKTTAPTIAKQPTSKTPVLAVAKPSTQSRSPKQINKNIKPVVSQVNNDDEWASF